MAEDEVLAPVKVRRQYVRRGFTPEQKLARLMAKKEAEKARRAINVEARRERIRVARLARLEAEKALKRAQRSKLPEDTPERKAELQAERQAKGKAKSKPRLPGRQRGGSIDAADVAIILALQEKKATNKEIAKVLNIGADTVARALADFADTRPLAKAYLRNKADQLARDAVDASHIAAGAGKAEPALELLDRLDVAPKRQDEANSPKTLIIVGGTSASALPTFPDFSAKALTE